MHHLFRVVTKAIILNQDRSKILILKKNNETYSLPGGHIDEDETPDDAMRRELYEECGVHAATLNKIDFFSLTNGKIVLAYSATIHSEDVLSQENNKEGIPVWITYEEFNKATIDNEYKDAVLSHWTKVPQISV